MFGKSGNYLLLMISWWLVPFLVLDLLSFPLWQNLPSYYPVFLPFIITGVFSLGCGRVEAKTGCWSRAGFWKKYLVLNGLYLLDVLVILILSISLHNHLRLRYFGGDAAGGFGWLYPYSVILYLVAGLILGVWKHFRRAK